VRTIRADIDVGFEVAPQRVPSRNETAERATFWVFTAGLAWTPFWYGSNDLVAWGINAILFPGLAAVYEVSILIKGERHPVGIRDLPVSAVLFAAVVLWILFQNATWSPSMFAHPIWGMASNALERPLEASISVNRDLTTLALVRLTTAASVFWVAVQLCRNALRASHLIESIAAISCMYSAYGLVAFAFNTGHMPWFEIPSTSGFVSSTFINRNSFATYAGIGLVAVCGLILRLYRHEVAAIDGPRQLRIASFIETTGQKGAVLLGGAFLILVALLLTGSRGGIIATGLGLLVFSVLTLRRGERRSTGQLKIMAFGIVLVVTVYLGFGDVLVGGIREKGFNDTSRLAVYLITLRSILDAPISGYGYGTFADVFPMYRDRSISLVGVWEQAHNTYLEVFQGLGLVFGSMLVASVLLLVLSCVKGATTRREHSTIPRVAASVAFLVGIHALVDFGLQIQAITLTFMAVLGAGVAQSESSRKTLGD
jgi:O-antigen ligase